MYDELVKRLRELAKRRRERVKCGKKRYPQVVPFETLLLDLAADAIEELSKCLDGVNDAHNEEYDVGYWARRRDYEPKWIPVEILPEPYEEVLVYLWKDKPYLASIDSTGEWCASDFIIDVDDMPTHWMPLPEPPKEDSNA